MDLSFILFIGITLTLCTFICYIILSLMPAETTESNKATKKRLLKIKNKEFDSGKAKETDYKGKNLISAITDDTEYQFAYIGNILSKIDIFLKLKKALKMADIKADASQFVIMLTSIFIVFSFLGFLTPQKQLGVILGLIFSTLIPFFIIKMKINKRLTLFTTQLPEALGLISSSLRAGHSLSSSFSIVVHEYPDPISGLFKAVCEDINLGRNTNEALDNMIEQMPGSLDLKFFVTAVLIQKEIGGNLAEILDSLNNTIRERFKLLGQLKAQTAQASLSGIVLALAPVIISGVIYLLNPKYMSPLFNSLIGQIAIGVALLMAFIGFLVIKKVTNISV